MFGYSSSEIINQSINLIIPSPISLSHDELLKEFIEE